MGDIGKNIKSLRISKKLTQDELAARLYVTRQTVSNYEIGKSRPDVQMLIRIAEVLDADVNELLYEPAVYSVRRKRYFRIAVVAAALAAVGYVLSLLDAYVVSHNRSPASESLIFVRLVLQPGYFFLLGWQVTASLCALRIGSLLPHSSRRVLRGCVAGLVSLLVLVLFPYYSVMFSALGIPYIRVPAFWLSVTHWITRNQHFIWISLLLGVLWGLSVPDRTAKAVPK